MPPPRSRGDDLFGLRDYCRAFANAVVARWCSKGLLLFNILNGALDRRGKLGRRGANDRGLKLSVDENQECWHSSDTHSLRQVRYGIDVDLDKLDFVFRVWGSSGFCCCWGVCVWCSFRESCFVRGGGFGCGGVRSKNSRTWAVSEALSVLRFQCVDGWGYGTTWTAPTFDSQRMAKGESEAEKRE